MKIGISQLIARNLSIEEFFRMSRDCGYEVVELSCKPDTEISLDTSTEDLRRIRRQAEEFGLEIFSMVHNQCPGSLLVAGADAEETIAQTEAGLRVAAELGAPCTLHTLGRQSPEVFYDDAYANAVAALKRIGTTAGELGTALAVEFVWSGFLFSPMEMRRFLDDVGSDHIGFYFDPGNMAVFQYPQHWARIVGKHIKGTHMKDWKGNALNGSWPALREGTVDFEAVLRELRDAGYDGPMISEVSESAASFAETAEAIRKIIDGV